MEIHRLCRRKKTGEWLSLVMSMVNRIEIGGQEWKDSVLLRYGIEPPDLPHHCDGCRVRLSIRNSLD